MSDSSGLNLFLERIMHINVLRMGGASAGILGTSGTDSDLVNNLKKRSITFAHEYSKPTPDNRALEQLVNDIYGLTQTLQLMHALSEEEASRLLRELQVLMEKYPKQK